MWENTEAWRQALLLAFFFSSPNLYIDIVRVAPFLLELLALLPEAAFIEAFATCQFFRKLGIHVASDLFNLNNGALHRLSVGKGELPHLAQEDDDVVYTFIQQEKTFINTQLRGTFGRLLEKRGTDTFITNHRCLLVGDGGQGRIRV